MVIMVWRTPKSNSATSTTLITDDSIADFESIPGVLAVIPGITSRVRAVMSFNRLETYANIIGIGATDLDLLGVELQEGEYSLTRGTAVIGAMIPSSFYDPQWRPGQEPPDPPDLVNQQVKMVLIKWDQDGNEIRKTIQIRITGILAESSGESDWSIYMSLDDVTAYNEWFMGRRINRNRDGYNQVMVKVEDVSQVLTVTETITSLGYQAYSPTILRSGNQQFFHGSASHLWRRWGNRLVGRSHRHCQYHGDGYSGTHPRDWLDESRWGNKPRCFIHFLG